MKKKYEFNTGSGDFALYDPETGKDWSNYLWNDKGYILKVSHLGAANSYYLDKNNVQVNLDCPLANFLYVRDDRSHRYWNIAGYPSLNGISGYKCVHGQGYTEISSVANRIAGKITYAVASDDTYEVWRVTLTNRDVKRRELSLFAVSAFDMNGYSQPVYYSAVTTSATRYSESANAVWCDIRNPYMPHGRCFGYISVSAPPFAYDGNLEKFIGTCGTFTKPAVLERGGDCGNTLATVRQRGGVLQNKVALEPGESVTLFYVLGLCDGESELESGHRARMADAQTLVERAAEYGRKRFGAVRTQSPDPRINGIYNYWVQKQVSYCTIGKKAVRDNAQLAMAALWFDAELGRKITLECVEHQYSDGHAVLTWYPYLEPNIYSDCSAWLIMCVCEYVKESGDFGFLELPVKYLDGGEASVFEHLKRAAQWYMRRDNYGKNGLPRIHHADWNDALNIPDDGAESVLMADFIVYAFGELAALCDAAGDDYSEMLRQKSEELKATVNDVAFNGEYYVRAFSEYGVVGDKQCTGGRIYVNPQSWSVLADIVPENRLESVLAAIDGMETDEGIPLCAPAYPEYDEHVGRMSGMLPGVYENGGIYNHAACFKIMADCKLGRTEHALKTLLSVIPGGEFNDCYKTTTEPYVFTNCYLKHPSVDMQVGFSWQTGTSGWGLRCYYEGILGIKRTYGGLEISPCIPRSWNKVTADRLYRGSVLHFSFERTGGGSVEIYADGKKLDGHLIRPFNDRKEHFIKVCY